MPNSNETPELANPVYYDAFSESYESERHHGYHLFLDEMETALLRRYLEPGHRVLEIGCGTGLIMRRIAPHVASVTGVDISQGMLRRALEKGMQVQRADAGAVPFPDACFDLVYSFKVLAHVRDIRAAARECARVLRPGGVAILEFYNASSLRALRKRLVSRRVARGVSEDQVFTRYDTPADMQSYLGDELRVEELYGLLVLTPAAQLHSAPLLGACLRGLERLATASPLGRYGGFLSVVARKA